MSNHQPVYLMAGGRGANNQTTTQVMRKIARDLGKGKPLIAYVGVAFRDNWGFYQIISNILKRAHPCEIERVNIARKNANLDQARKVLQNADAIFMSGGDVEAGMQVLIEKNMVESLHEQFAAGKLFFGTSAGSIMLADKWVRWKNPEDDSTAELFPCLGIAPVVCDTHAEEDDWVELKTVLQLEGDGEGYGIPSNVCLKVNADGTLEALGGSIPRFIYQDAVTKRISDLLPVHRLML